MPRSMESSSLKCRCGVNFRTTRFESRCCRVRAAGVELGHAPLCACVSAADDADEDVRVLEVGRDVDLLHGDERGLKETSRVSSSPSSRLMQFVDSFETVLHGKLRVDG